MDSTSELVSSARLSVENVGGIDETGLTLERGVNVLAGRNATNRTSTLRALMAALGSDGASLKADADRGRVELELGDEAHTRTFERTDGGVVTDGDPMLEDPTVADLYAFLLESNEARRAVARGDDLREIIMRPVDTDEIQAEIDALEREKRQVEEQLSELDSLEDRLPELRQREGEIEERLEDKREELEAKREEIEDSNADIEETREEKAELESKLETLQDLRATLEDVRYDIETEQESIERLHEELDEYRDREADLPEAPADRIEELDAEIDRLRRRKQRLESDITELQSIIQFNQEMLEDHDPDVFDSLGENGEDGSDVTDQLVTDAQEVTCWTCGSDVETDQIESTTDRIQSFQADKREERAEIDSRIRELDEERTELRDRRQRRERLERQIEQTEDEIEQREGRVERLRERREEVTEELEAVDEEVESLRSGDYDEVLDLHREANELELACDRLAGDLEDVRSEIEDLEERLEEREEREERREEISDELADLRTRVEQIEREAVDAFNEHMADLLDVLGYTNLDRIWLERTEREVREGRRKVTRTVFDLHIVRSTAEGAAYEDTIDHLSESEREVTGLVFALAGYLVHDVHEQVPFMVLDSLEAIDSERIADLVEYFETYVDYMVVALLPEDAQALDEEYRRVMEA